MNKFWVVYSEKNSGTFKRYETMQGASDDAKRMAAASDNEFIILEAIGTTKKPVPPIEIVELT